MQFPGTNPMAGALAFLVSALSLLTTVFWLVVGWRAMRAHEEIAAALRERRRE